MAEEIRQVDYFYTTLPHRSGEGARVLEAFREAGVNFLALHAFPEGGEAQLDFFPEDPEAFLAAAEDAGVELSPRHTAFLIRGRDRVGAAAEILGKLGDAGINVIALDAVTVDGGFGVLLWVERDAADRAAEVLGA